MQTTSPGQTLKMTIRREKKDQEISVTLGKRPANMNGPATEPTTKPKD